MGVITLTFNAPLNDSIQIGDTVYYTPTSTVGNFLTGGTKIKMGTVVTIPSRLVITCNIDDDTDRPGANDFIFFSKDNAANVSSLVGYYADVTLENNSTSKAELFSVGSEFSESSK